MSYITVENELKSIPEQYMGEVMTYLQFLKWKINSQAEKSQEKPKRKLGSLNGQMWMADDFDAPLDEFKEYM